MSDFLVIDIETTIMKGLVNASEFPNDNISDDEAYIKYRDKLLEDSNQKSDFFPVIFHRPISISYVHAGSNYKIKKTGVLPDGDDGVVKFWEFD